MVKTWTPAGFDTDLSTARTLDASWYIDPAMLEIEQERIFARTWQPVAKTAEVANIGDYVTGEVAGEPIVVTRDQNNEIRAYYNVCRHRAGAVARGKGNRKSLQCLYHGWTYGLDGCLMSLPEFEGVQNFDKANFGLVPVRAEVWGPFVFVNLDPNAPPMADVWNEVIPQTANYDFSQWALVERRDYLVDCNWKVYIDNYLEGYHVPMAHPGLARELDYDAYRVDTFRYHSFQYAPIKPLNKGNAKNRRYTETEADAQALYYWIFPNFMLNIYPDNMSSNIILPVGHDKTLTIFEWFFKDPTQTEAIEKTIAFSDEIQWEDIEICEYVQKGLRSRVYNNGRFSVKRENGVHHFQSLVHEFINRTGSA